MTEPVAMISSAMVVARLTGMAKPSPMLPPDDSPDELGTVAPAVGTPMSWPEQLTMAPPLLPGLMAASLWIAETSSAAVLFSAGTWMVRSRALMIPEVTVPDNPSGAPITTFASPTWTEEDEPIAMTGSVRETSALSTARSVCGSRPVIVAGALCPSENWTSTDPPLAATAMTWLLVRMYPLDRMTSPDPVPLPPLPRAEMVTTEGMTLFATEVTSHTLSWLELAVLAGAAEDFVAAMIAPPATPPTTSAPTSAAGSSHRFLLCPCFDPVTTVVHPSWMSADQLASPIPMLTKSVIPVITLRE